jgi:hypothetical protein
MQPDCTAQAAPADNHVWFARPPLRQRPDRTHDASAGTSLLSTLAVLLCGEGRQDDGPVSPVRY